MVAEEMCWWCSAMVVVVVPMTTIWRCGKKTPPVHPSSSSWTLFRPGASQRRLCTMYGAKLSYRNMEMRLSSSRPGVSRETAAAVVVV